jgi:hypothetical protein
MRSTMAREGTYEASVPKARYDLVRQGTRHGGGTGGDEAGQKRGSQAEDGVDRRVVEPVRCAVQAAIAGRKVWS